MKPLVKLAALVLSLASAWPQETRSTSPSLRGGVTDPSGAAVPGAAIDLRGPRGTQHAKTRQAGEYAFFALTPGDYRIKIAAKGFATVERSLSLDRPMILDAQLVIQGEAQVITVEDRVGSVGVQAESNAGAIVIGRRQLAALSDDPDELALQLMALAGPAPGPNGGEMFIDGFSGGNIPPKSAIREVRINANPFSPEYDRPGFSRVEIFTKPGSDKFHGEAFGMFNDQYLNSRNPLLSSSRRPPYSARSFGFNFGGPLKKNKSSFTFDAEHRNIGENAFILATVLDSSLKPLPLNEARPTPQARTSITPRLDLAIGSKNTLAIRYQALRIALDNLGVGDFNLASRAYNERETDQTVQVTETAALTPHTVNETRAQYLRSSVRDHAGSAAPGIYVQDAFFDGGATGGNSAIGTNVWEITNTTFYNRGRHAWKWGGRIRQARRDDTSFNNFSGTYTFFTLAQYEQTLALEQAGYTGPQITQRGFGPSQFSLNDGTPATRVAQTDAGFFLNDDWRLRPNLTLSLGFRYEAQTNLSDHNDWAPRVAVAWGLDGSGARPAKTVLRAGFGTFYDRVPITTTLNALRFNGATQQSYFITNPTFFPAIPSADQLRALGQPQQLRPVFSGLVAPRIYQSNVSIERQLDATSRVSLSWISTRGVYLPDSRNINAPIGGLNPYGDSSIRLLSEDAGFNRLNQLVLNANVNRKKVIVFGYYALSYGKDNNEGLPADPYNLRAEWGPSGYGDVRHRAAIGSTIPLPWKLNVSPFVVANSGFPYNITTGFDPELTGYPVARPALISSGPSDCQGPNLTYAPGFGCFNLNPAPGTPAIGHNFARGPANVNVVLRAARTWAFGGEATATGSGSSHAGGMQGGPPASMVAANTGRRYNLTLSASTLNALNHPNFAVPNGDLSSPYFGQYRGLGGLIVLAHGGAPSTYNRKIDLQLRFTF